VVTVGFRKLIPTILCCPLCLPKNEKSWRDEIIFSSHLHVYSPHSQLKKHYLFDTKQEEVVLADNQL